MAEQLTPDNDVIVVSKLSIKTMGSSGKLLFGAPEGTPFVVLGTIYGMASGLKLVEDKITGVTHTAITGNFEGTNTKTGKRYQSGIVYLPPGIHDQAVDAVRKLQEESDSVAFAFEIRVVPDTNAAGYSYQGRSLVKPQGIDPLDAIRNQVAEKTQKQLEPAPVAQIEAPKGAAKK